MVRTAKSEAEAGVVSEQLILMATLIEERTELRILLLTERETHCCSQTANATPEHERRKNMSI
jgi:hypothetical protein